MRLSGSTGAYPKRKIMKQQINRKTNAPRATGYLAAILLLLTPVFSFAQADIHFSQFYETSILRNPALTGVFADDYKFGAYYRNQWATISNPFQTFLVSAETRISVSHMSEDFLSFGLLGYADKAGSLDQKITAIYPAINYNKSINVDHSTYLSAGFTGGYIQYSFDPSKATFNNQYQNNSYSAGNPSQETITSSTMRLWDVGAGINFNTNAGQDNKITYMLGVSGYHFTQPEFSYFKDAGITQNIRWNANMAIGFDLSEHVLFQVHANYATQGTYKEIIAGGMLNWTMASSGPTQVYVLSLGAFYRFQDALMPVVKLKYKNMAIGVSYDVNTSTLKPASLTEGGYEITLFIIGRYANGNGDMSKKLVCPRF